jgi:TatD DNase family protein
LTPSSRCIKDEHAGVVGASALWVNHLMLIDSHCHLDYFTSAELPDVLARAAAAGVREMVTIGTTLTQSQGLLTLTDAHPEVWCTVGVHPHHAAEAPVPAPETLAAFTRHPKVIGIGESGLDYFYDRAPRDVQQTNFRVHIRAAQLAGLPLAIHSRDAEDDTARILQEEWETGGAFAFVLHCFSSARSLAEAGLGLGGFVSFSGILTFPKSQDLRDIAREVPAERLLVETDSPYLAPVPVRGKRNEPSYVTHTAKVLAELRGLTPEALADLTTVNFRQLFRRTA